MEVLIKHSKILWFEGKVDSMLSSWHKLTSTGDGSEVSNFCEVEVKRKV
jgi:hypothetical protein